jgi:hypothetical protein
LSSFLALIEDMRNVNSFYHYLTGTEYKIPKSCMIGNLMQYDIFCILYIAGTKLVPRLFMQYEIVSCTQSARMPGRIMAVHITSANLLALATDCKSGECLADTFRPIARGFIAVSARGFCSCEPHALT